MRLQCELEVAEKIRLLCERYDKSIESLLQKLVVYHTSLDNIIEFIKLMLLSRLQETEDKWRLEKERRVKFESDFRVTQPYFLKIN